MRTIISWIFLAPLFAVILSFAVSNREILTLRLWPTDYEVSAPLFAIALSGMFIGFLWGAVTVWMSGGETRRRARREASRAADAEREAERLRAEVAVLEESQRADHAQAALDGDQTPGLPALRDNPAATATPRIL